MPCSGQTPFPAESPTAWTSPVGQGRVGQRCEAWHRPSVGVGRNLTQGGDSLNFIQSWKELKRPFGCGKNDRLAITAWDVFMSL
jgi:hypothetical protein